MASWVLYLADYAAASAISTIVYESGSWTNGPNMVYGKGTSVTQIDNDDADITFQYTSAQLVGDIALFNHNCGDGSSPTIVQQYYDGSWQNVSAPQSIASNADTVFTFNASGISKAWHRVKITGCSGKAIGGMSLIGRTEGEVITFTDVDPRYPIGQTLNAAITMAETGTGALMQQQHGGAWRTMSIDVPYIQSRDTTAGQEGKLDDYFLDEVWDVQGFPGPWWLSDDNGDHYYATLVLPIEYPITDAGARVTARLNFRTVPHVGVS